MREIFNPGQAARDFRQRYLSSYGLYTTESKRRVIVQMSDVNDGVATFQDAAGNVYRANAGAGVEFEFIPVPKKLLVINDQLYFVRRAPARQWSRGINANNTAVINLVTGRPLSLSFDIVDKTLTAERADPTVELSKWENGQQNTVVLSDQFGIHKDKLYVYNLHIGKAIAADRELEVRDKMFSQEVKDLVSTLNLGYRVV